MSAFAAPRANEPPYPPMPPMPPQPGVDPTMPRVHVNTPMVYVEPQFEYRTVSRALVDGPLPQAELDELGKDGWELVSAIGDGKTAHFYFKRMGR